MLSAARSTTSRSAEFSWGVVSWSRQTAGWLRKTDSCTPTSACAFRASAMMVSCTSVV
jgi:hypothetical protein